MNSAMMIGLLAALGVAVLGLVLVELALQVLSSARRLAAQRGRQALEAEILNERLALARWQRRKREESPLPWYGNRKFEVARKVQETPTVCSFYLQPHDGKPLPAFIPGQYLTFELDIPGHSKRVVRCYSLSDRPRPDYYRVTIKRLASAAGERGAGTGVASNFFHHAVKVGNILDVRAPAGAFCLDLTRGRPVVLVAGGIGLTPMASMLQEIVETGSRCETWLFYGVHDGTEHVFKDRLERVARDHPPVRLEVGYSVPRPEDRLGRDFQHAGRISIERLKQVLPSNNYDFFVCGPAPLMTDITAGLRAWGVPDHCIHTEAFGPASIRPAAAPEGAAASSPEASVVFAKSQRRSIWTGQSGSLLELAEASGLSLDFGCRAGNCGTCRTAIKSGAVRYLKDPGCEVESGTCLTCICVPAGDLMLEA